MALILTGEPLDEQQWALLTQPGFEDLLQTPRYYLLMLILVLLGELLG